MRLNSVGRKEVSFLFDRIAAQSVRHKYIIKSARSTWEFRPTTGNAGTGKCQRGAFEQGCEYAPVAGTDERC